MKKSMKKVEKSVSRELELVFALCEKDFTALQTKGSTLVTYSDETKQTKLNILKIKGNPVLVATYRNSKGEPCLDFVDKAIKTNKTSSYFKYERA